MSEEIELKECPFCGSDNIEIRVWQPSGYSIWCLNCEAQTSREFAKTLSIERWNTRHESGELPGWLKIYIGFKLEYIDVPDGICNYCEGYRQAMTDVLSMKKPEEHKQ